MRFGFGYVEACDGLASIRLSETSAMHSQHDATITVVIPTHNRKELLRACLRGVLAQESVDFDIIVVDDGSTDGTSASIAELGDSRVRVIRQERPLGVATSRNAGIRHAKGSWIAFTDDDDLWAPSKLFEQLCAASATGATFIYCGAVVFSDNTDRVTPDRPVPSPELMQRSVLRGNPLPGGASAQMVRRDVLMSLGGFDTRLHLLADWDLWIRLADLGALAAVDKPLVAYRRHDGNMVVAHPNGHLEEFDVIVAKHREAARRCGVKPDGVGFNYWIANGQRRAGRRWSATRIHFNAAVRYKDLGHLGSALRSPLGDWAIGVRAATPPRPEAPPAWLDELRTASRPTE